MSDATREFLKKNHEQINKIVEKYDGFLICCARFYYTEVMIKQSPMNDDTLEYERFLSYYNSFESMQEKIRQSRQQLLFSTTDKLANYVKEYSVDGSKLDGYKFNYWYGESVLEIFPQKTESQIAGLALVHSMGEMLVADVHKGLSKIMEDKITKTVLENNGSTIYGQYGLYWIYKNISRMCWDTCQEFTHPCHP